MKKSRNTIGVLFAVILILAGSIGEWCFMTNFGKTSVQERKIIAQSGNGVAMNTFIPQNATAENKAPAVIIVHGGNDDKDLMTRYALELARRGYVAVAIDMYSHGDSEWLPDSQWLTAGRGSYDTVREVVEWPFVDAGNISMMGYSRGGKACGEALELDNQELNVIKNIFVLFSDPIYKNEQGFTDVYGPRNIAVLADKYDEFFFTEKAEDTGTYSNDKNKYLQTLTSPVTYIENASAQSFLHFGQDPEGLEKRSAGTIYEKEYDGITATREIKTMGGDHMQGHYNPVCITTMLDFFARVSPSVTGVNSGSPLLLGYDLSALGAMVGFLLLLVFGAALVVEKTTYFKGLMGAEPQITEVSGRQDRIWYWVTVAGGVLVTIAIIWWANKMKLGSWNDSVFRSAKFVFVPILCILGAVFTLIVNTLMLKKKNPEQTRELIKSRILIGRQGILKTFLLALLAVVVFYIIIFAGKYFLGITYKFTLWGFQTFSVGRVPYMILVFPMLVLFYVATAITNDGFGYSSILSRNKMFNSILTAFISALPMGAVMLYFYARFWITGWNPMFGGNAAAGAGIYQLPMIIFVMVLISRKLFEKTGNIYLGAFIAGMLTSIMTCSVCEIRIPEQDAPFKVSPLIIGFIFFAYAVFIFCLKYYQNVTSKERDTK